MVLLLASTLNDTRLAWLDWMFCHRPLRAPASNLVLVNIDADNSLAQIGPWPWPRSVHAQLIDRLHDMGARVIAFDMFFTRPTADDAVLDAAVKRHGSVIFGMKWDDTSKVWLQPLDSLQDAHYAHIAPGRLGDQKFRAVELEEHYPGQTIDALSWEAAKLSGAGGRVPLTPDRNGNRMMLINFIGPRGSFRRANQEFYYVDVLNGKVPPDAFKGKTVLVYNTFDTNDAFDTPVSSRERVAGMGPELMPGGEVHAQALDTLLSGRFLRTNPIPPPLWALLGVLVGSACVYYFRGIGRWLGLALALSLIFWASVLLFAHDMWFDPVVPGLGMVLALAAVVLMENGRLMRVLAQFVTPEFAQSLLYGENPAELGGQMQDVTVLFSDIRGYTALTKKHDALTIVGILNEYHTAMNEIFKRFGGTVLDYQGDAQMVAFGLSRQKGAAATEQACEAALEMQRRIAQMCQAWEAAGRPTFEVGIGICAGPAAVAVVGGSQRRQFTVIGDPVNLASRLQGKSKELNSPIVLDPEAASRVKAEVADLGSHVVKGLDEPVPIFGLVIPGSK
ncbi:MAG: CHASE2 domain-containing protein [Candidatus Xenobia bacterium]